MEKQTNKHWYWILIKGIIMILLAVLILQNPGGSLLAIALYIGIGFLVTGLIVIVQGFALKKHFPNWGWRVFEGILDIVLGFILIAHPALTATVLPFIIGFWGVIYGFYLTIDGFSGDRNAVVKSITGILLLILSFLIMFNPVFAGVALVIWVGIILLIGGIYNVIGSFSLK
ncbi:MAG: DUF308 domain-containing protein [Bacteroidales bacterium]|nr:DUF308 domain-containing protein [Bacteroidales bacterium]